jgi:hypothetical protein
MKMAQINRILCVPMLTAALALCGCATIYENTHAYIGSPEATPTTPDHVQIYQAEPKVPKVTLGEIILSIDGNPSRQKIEEKLKKAGAKLGADGVFVTSDRTHVYPTVYWDYWGPVNDEVWHRMVVGVAFKNGNK